MFICNPRTQGGSGIQGQSELHNELNISLGYIETPSKNM